MKISFSYKKTALVDSETVNCYWQKIAPFVDHLSLAVREQREDKYQSIYLPFEEKLQREVAQVAAQKRQLSPVLLLLIGMGGSSLATRALYSLLAGSQEIPICFVDTTDSDYIWRVYTHVEKELRAGNQIILNVISKSGDTLETAANADLFIALMKKYRASAYKNYIVVTTDKDFSLWRWAIEESISVLEIPKLVGGRYSAFSPVALFPLALIGASIDELCAGARLGVFSALTGVLDENVTAMRAILIYIYYLKSHLIHDIFLFSADLQEMGMWYRQLVSESLGKDEKGILPTVSIGSADMHSMVQLYLGGGLKRFTTFVAIEKNNKDLELPNNSALSLHDLTTILFKSVSYAYLQKKEPFCTFIVPQKSLFYIGQLMQMMMIEVVYVSFLLQVNPFDQPHVDLYKQEAKRLVEERTV